MKTYLFYISQNYSFAILRPVQTRLWRRGDKVYWFFEGSEVNPAFLLPDEKRVHSIAQIQSLKPDAVLAPANKIPTFIPGLKVGVFHGFDAGKVDNRGNNDHFKVRGCFDLYCTQGPSTTRVFKRLQQSHGYFNVIETGWPALDPLFTTSPSTQQDKPTVLFCSTFSKRLSSAAHLHPIIERISRQQDWNWLIQFHPKMDRQTVARYRSIQHQHLTVVDTDNIIPLLQRADVMLCDTSSVISMFIVQQKPVVTYRNICPGAHLINIDDSALIESSIERALSRPSALMANIEKHVNELHPLRDGQSAQRVVEAIDDVLAGKHPLSKTKPANVIRNLTFRKKLGYWGL